MPSERLPRLPTGRRIITPAGTVTQDFQLWWQRICQELEKGRSYMGDLFPLTIYADHTGTPNTGQLPLDVQAQRFLLDTDVTRSSTTWSFEVTEGSVTATIGAATGILNITAVGAVYSVVKIISTREGLTLDRSFSIHRQDAAAPPSGGGGGGAGGTTATDSTLSGINSASYAQISDDMYVTIGSAGEVRLTAPLTVRTANDTVGTYEVKGIWRRYNAGSYSVDIATEVASDPDASVVSIDIDGTATNKARLGTLTVNPATITGRTPATVDRYALFAKNTSGTKPMTFTGTASAVGS